MPNNRVSNSNETFTDDPSEKLPHLSKRALRRRKNVIAQHNAELRNQRKAEEAGFSLGQDDFEISYYFQNEDAGLSASREKFDETTYYFENGLRKVYPYQSVIADRAKDKWVGRTLKNVFEKELRYEPDDLEKALCEGKVLINGKRPSINYVVKDCDYISRLRHGHENPVTDCPLAILTDTDDVIVVNKPSSIPCHPCGRYQSNSVVSILAKEKGYTNLQMSCRLDRLTSGVLILGKTETATKKLNDYVTKRQMQKEYICRVMGEFPRETLTVDQPLQALSHKPRLQIVSSAGKPSQTVFTRLSYNGTSSVVKCVPITGRTHQIRVHLQYLGHPIINDAFYNSNAWGPNKGKGGVYEVPNDIVHATILERERQKQFEGGENPLFHKKLEEMKQRERLSPASQQKFSKDSSTFTHKNLPSEETRVKDSPIATTKSQQTTTRPGFDWTKWQVDSSCDLCRMMDNPKPRDLVMFLHALKYKSPDWEYQTELPDWAHDDWQDEDQYMLEGSTWTTTSVS